VQQQNLPLAELFGRVVSRLLRRKKSAAGVINTRRSGDPRRFWMVGNISADGLSREYQVRGSAWKDVLIVGAVIVSGIALTRPGLLDRLLHGSPAAVSKGDVLVVSVKDVDVLSVRQTASPRGYNVLLAGNVEDGVGRLQGAGGHIALVIVDGDMPGAKRVISAAKRDPNARLVVLTGARQARDVSERLLAAGIR
jgi:hypothetical protein